MAIDPLEQSKIYNNDGFDLDLLLHKLEGYKTRVEGMEAQFTQQRSFSSKEAADVAAAARFKLELELLRHAGAFPSVENVEKESIETAPKEGEYLGSNIKKEEEQPQWPIRESVEVRQSVLERRKIARPLQLQHLKLKPAAALPPPQVQSALLPPRTSSRFSPIVERLHGMSQSPLPDESSYFHRRMTISGDQQSSQIGEHQSTTGSFVEIYSPPLPSLASPASDVTWTSSPPPPATPLTLCPPNEDQLRRELEFLAMYDGVETLEQRYKQRRPPKILLPEVDDDDDDAISMMEDEATVTKSQYPPRTDSRVRSKVDVKSENGQLRRKKSILTFFQRKSPVDELIEMYMDDPEPKVKEGLTRQPSKLRRTFSFRNTSGEQSPDASDIPPLPSILRMDSFGDK